MKPKKCKVCKEQFVPFRPLQIACSHFCAIEYAQRLSEKRAANEALKQRQELRKAKLALKPKQYWITQADKACHKYIRLRDEDEPCISCGRTEVEWTVGGSWDAGHYLSKGSHPELRYEETNIHKQCKSCNGGSGKYVKKNHTVSKSYRENLVKKIGLDKVEWLEGPHEPKKYTIDELKEIKRKYSNLIKEMK